MIVPKNVFYDLTYVRVDVMTYNQIQKNPEFQNMNSNFNKNNINSNFIKLTPFDLNFNNPVTIKMKTIDGSKAASVYRLSPNFLVMTKITSNLIDGYQVFQTQQTGTYIARIESNYGVIIGAVIGVVVFLIVIMVIVVVLVKNPKYISSIRNRARYTKRSFFSKV